MVDEQSQQTSQDDNDLAPGQVQVDDETGEAQKVRDVDSGDAVTVIDSAAELPDHTREAFEMLSSEAQDALLRDWKADGVHVDAYGDLRTKSGAEVFLPASADGAPRAESGLSVGDFDEGRDTDEIRL